MSAAVHRPHGRETPPAGATPRWRPRLLRLLWAAVLVSALPAQSARENVGMEYRIKAAFLYNFSRFVEWPPQRFGGDRPLAIGVLEKNPFGDELQNVVNGRRINGRRIVVTTVESLEDTRALDVIFVCAATEHRLEEFMPALAAGGVLTVGESESFAHRGGVIHFTLDGDKVRFEVNLTAAERHGLKLSAQLLKLATAVRRRP